MTLIRSTLQSLPGCDPHTLPGWSFLFKALGKHRLRAQEKYCELGQSHQVPAQTLLCHIPRPLHLTKPQFPRWSTKAGGVPAHRSLQRNGKVWSPRHLAWAAHIQTGGSAVTDAGYLRRLRRATAMEGQGRGTCPSCGRTVGDSLGEASNKLVLKGGQTWD